MQSTERLLALPAANPAMVSVYKDYLKLDLVLSRPKAEELGFSDSAGHQEKFTF